MITEILMGLAKANLAAGAAIVAVAAIRALVRPRFGALAAYLLWLAPLAAGLAALAPHPAARAAMAPVVLTATAAVQALAADAPAALDAAPDAAGVAFGLWITGALAAAALLLRRQAAFLAAMGRLQPLAGGVFRAESAGVGPAVVGVVRPRIVAPADFVTRFGAPERDLILAHERAHLRRGDAAVNALACAAQCLCWFNPLVHLAARLLRIDQELACDATVIGRFPQMRRAYAELLLKTQLATQPLPLGCHWPAASAHPLKKRIAMLGSPLPQRAMRGMGLVVAAALSLGAGGLAWATQPAASGHRPPGEVAALAARDAAALPEPPKPASTERAEAPTARIPIRHGPQPRTVTAPDWTQKPVGADVARVYPKAAEQDRVGGSAVIACRFGDDLRLHGCKVVRESPPQDGFGAAALALAPLFQAKPLDKTGAAVAGAAIRIPIRFLPPGPGPASGPGVALITRPTWIEKPTSAEVARFYPPEALKQHFEGMTTLSCGVAKDGRLTDCTVSGPTGFGAPQAIREDFRKATLELAGFFRMQPQLVDGRPTADGRINIPIRWSLPTDPAAKARLDALTG